MSCSTTRFASITVALAGVLLSAAPSGAAEKLVATQPGTDFDLSSTPVAQMVSFSAADPVTGVDLTAEWIAVVADEENGLYPWSLDLNPQIEAPGGAMLDWPVVGGDRTYADYPFQDFHAGFNAVDGNGTFTWTFVNSSPQPPFTMGLRNVQLHLMTEVPDVVEVRNDTTEAGPLWRRPYFIAGISGLGPVSYHVIEFEVPVSGGYVFESVVDSGNNFTCLYRGGFDPGDPFDSGDLSALDHLLDYGLGNGFGPNGTPQGTSLIEALLFEGERYYYVTSQWSATSDPQPFTTTITGPALIDTDLTTCPADLAGDDDAVTFADLLVVLTNWGTDGPGAELAEPLDETNFADLLALLAVWGACG